MAIKKALINTFLLVAYIISIPSVKAACTTEEITGNWEFNFLGGSVVYRLNLDGTWGPSDWQSWSVSGSNLVLSYEEPESPRCTEGQLSLDLSCTAASGSIVESITLDDNGACEYGGSIPLTIFKVLPSIDIEATSSEATTIGKVAKGSFIASNTSTDEPAAVNVQIAKEFYFTKGRSANWANPRVNATECFSDAFSISLNESQSQIYNCSLQGIWDWKEPGNSISDFILDQSLEGTLELAKRFISGAQSYRGAYASATRTIKVFGSSLGSVVDIISSTLETQGYGGTVPTMYVDYKVSRVDGDLLTGDNTIKYQFDIGDAVAAEYILIEAIKGISTTCAITTAAALQFEFTIPCAALAFGAYIYNSNPRLPSFTYNLGPAVPNIVQKKFISSTVNSLPNNKKVVGEKLLNIYEKTYGAKEAHKKALESFDSGNNSDAIQYFKQEYVFIKDLLSDAKTFKETVFTNTNTLSKNQIAQIISEVAPQMGLSANEREEISEIVSKMNSMPSGLIASDASKMVDVTIDYYEFILDLLEAKYGFSDINIVPIISLLLLDDSPQEPNKEPNQRCGVGRVYDCALICVQQGITELWQNDDFCDDGSFSYFDQALNREVFINLNCPVFNNDGGDCN